MDEGTFREALKRDGFGTVDVVEWEAGRISKSHAHDFDVSGMLLEGAMTVTTDSAAMACQPGDTFTVAADTPHTEAVGPNGARVLIGRKATTT
ncbi:MAG: cupin domain-containing protein [Alphaproteobacteria bacterium]|nr:cupin domain-containing protein [Alphaproteobacteria bacterium]